MGKLKDKVNKVFNKIKGIEENNYLPVETINLQQQIYAQEAAIDSQVGSTSILNDIKWNRWIHINLWADYFANRFKYEASEYKHNFAINRAIRNAFIYGRIGIWNNNGTPEVVFVVKEENERYRVSVLKNDDEEFYAHNERNKYIYVDKTQVIHYQFSSLGYSAFITLQPVLKMEQLVQKVLYNEILTNATRILRDTEAGSSSTSAKQFINFNSPVIHRIDGGTDRYTGLTLDTNTEKVIETIEYSKNWYYDILGRRTNSDFKKTHSLDSEIEAGQFNTNVLERDKYMFLKKFLRDYSKLFKVSILLENENGEMDSVFAKLKIQKEVKNEVKTSN